jgi:two-component sensor histidine kinase
LFFSSGRLSTGVKMLLILSVALLPLGLIALFASMESAKTNRLYRESEARRIVSDGARKLDVEIAINAFRLSTMLKARPADARSCLKAMAVVPPSQRQQDRFALFAARGERLCADPGFSLVPGQAPRGGGTEILLLPPARTLRLIVAGPAGSFGIGEIPLPALAEIIEPPKTRRTLGDMPNRSFGAALVQGTARLPIIIASDSKGLLNHLLTATAPVAGGQAVLETTVTSAPITAPETLMVLLPLLMWIAAAVTGWLVVDRLLLSPLAQMQRAISSYRAGDGPLTLPKLTTPSHEIRGLGDSFRKVTSELASHEAELEQGLARQTQLTREVHHRVKNNLQVISSLINLHSRGAADGAAAAAYASIQRRVDALAIVHRNHYAELEENKGVSLRALVGELAASIRTMAPPEAARMTITLNMMAASVTQDVAVPVAFLITEIVELVTICAGNSSVTIMLQPGSTQQRALLTIEAPGLDAEACLKHSAMDRFRRIIQGLARQLRSPLRHEEGTGRFEIEIAIVPEQTRTVPTPR